jgi:peptidoglycan/LPS O-acetylase OafA/YrhL
MAVIAASAVFYRGAWTYMLLAAGFMANFASYLGIGIPHGPGVFWSLAVEEHFYLGWPLAVRLLPRRMLLVLCLIIFCGEPVLRAVAFRHGLDPEALIYPASWFRFDGLALGAILAIWIRSRRCSVRSSLWLASLMLGASVLIVIAGKPFGVLGTKTLASTSLRYTHMQLFFGACILGSLALGGTWVTAPFRTSFVRISSDLSYCVYLIHLSVGDGYHWVLRQFGLNPSATLGPRGAWLCQCVAIIGVTFGLAALSKKYLEGPCLRLKRHFV